MSFFKLYILTCMCGSGEIFFSIFFINEPQGIVGIHVTISFILLKLFHHVKNLQTFSPTAPRIMMFDSFLKWQTL